MRADTGSRERAITGFESRALSARVTKLIVTIYSKTCNNVLYITQTCQCNILQYFTGCKNDNFQMKMFDIFLIFAQNIDCGYTLEPPQ